MNDPAVFPAPQQVFRYFAKIAAIPHGSGNTAAVRAWCLAEAERLGISAKADAAGNVILRTDGTCGMENRPRVILQGHLDMVCAKLPSCGKNMETDGLTLIWSGDTLTADGTTLGADDGIAVAYAFALLADRSIPHPPLTVLLTADEETGMEGAAGLDPAELDGSCLINLDSEDEGIFTVGCAGGVRVHMCLPAVCSPCSGTRLSLRISGLTGGHSGSEIHKKRLNANTAMLHLLDEVPVPFSLAAFSGGVRDNVIPTECEAEILCDPCDADAAITAVRAAFSALSAVYGEDPAASLALGILPADSADAVPAEQTAALLRALLRLPNGIQHTDPFLGLPVTSLNLGIMAMQDGGFHTEALVRSGINAEWIALRDALIAQTAENGGSAYAAAEYPAWESCADSALVHTAAGVFRRLYGCAPKIETIHAGVECGLFCGKKPGLSCISFGPDIADVHTPRETLSIPSAARTWDFLLALLAAL